MKKNNRSNLEQYFTALNQTNIITTNIFTSHQDDIQTSNQCPFCNINFRMSLLEDQLKGLLDLVSHTETQKGLASILRQEIQGLTRLVQALDSKKPIQLRTYPTKHVDNLIFQTQKLTGFLLRYVIPNLEHVGSSKKRHS